MISILTAAWNGVQFTASYLRSLAPLITSDMEVMIFDNGSTDSTPECLASWQGKYNWLRVMSCPDNLGFPKANNILANNSYGDVLIFLNNDIRIEGDFITPLTAPLANNPNQIVGATLIDFPAGWNEFDKELIPYLNGWCLAITKKAFFDLGAFDERYGLCDYEDVDLSYKALKAGMSLTQAVVPIVHFSGQSGKYMQDRHSITQRNRKLFAEKWNLKI